MKHIFVVNPTAGKKNQIEYIRDYLKDFTDLDYEVYETKSVGDATQYVRTKALENESETYRFYACGGDGTINEVVSGLLGLSNVSFTCYPCGSGNDFIKASEGDFKDIKALIDGEEEYVDIIRCNDRISVNIVNIGFDAAVSYNMLKFKKWPLVSGHTAYNLALVYSLIKEMKHKAKIYVDDELKYDGNFLLSAACNGICCGGGYYFAPHAKINDGVIEQLIIKSITRIKFISLVKHFKDGTYKNYPKIMKYLNLFSCKKIRVESEKDIICGVDGDSFKTKTLEIEILHNAIKFVKPKTIKA